MQHLRVARDQMVVLAALLHFKRTLLLVHSKGRTISKPSALMRHLTARLLLLAFAFQIILPLAPYADAATVGSNADTPTAAELEICHAVAPSPANTGHDGSSNPDDPAPEPVSKQCPLCRIFGCVPFGLPSVEVALPLLHSAGQCVPLTDTSDPAQVRIRQNFGRDPPYRA